MIKFYTIIPVILCFNGALLAKSIVSQDQDLDSLAPSQPPEPLHPNLDISSDSAIQQRYSSLFERIVEGNFNLSELTHALAAVTAQMTEVNDCPSYVQKLPLLKNFSKSVRQFLNNPNLFTEQSEEAMGARKIMFFRLQKALEISGEDLLDTKDRLWKALGSPLN